MSGDHFHVHGAHEHELEHKAAHGPGLTQSVAIFTAVLSTIGAVVSYQGSATQNEAMMYKNEAVLKKTQASDQWNFYQAKSNKAHMADMAIELVPARRQAYFREQKAKYEADKLAIKEKAEALEEESRIANEKSEELMHPHHKLAQAMTLIQIAISLASVTALTHKRWLLAVAGAAAAGGVVLVGAQAFG